MGNFPGFRKGQIPPFAQPQITLFAIQESIINTCESAVNAFGLKSIPGAEGDVDIKEDVKLFAKGYKQGTDIEFTATFKGTYDESKRNIEDDDDDDDEKDGIIDADVVLEDDEASDTTVQEEALSNE